MERSLSGNVMVPRFFNRSQIKVFKYLNYRFKVMAEATSTTVIAQNTDQPDKTGTEGATVSVHDTDQPDSTGTEGATVTVHDTDKPDSTGTEEATVTVQDIDKQDTPRTEGATATDVEEQTNDPEESKKKAYLKFEEIKGDLFSCPKTDSLAHCVSADLRMGKGIAVIFKKKFMGMPDLNKQRKGPGSVAILNRQGRFIYYLITKLKYNEKPTYETLKKSLIDMQKHCESNGVKSVSMPRIGCGLDGLVWHRVEAMVKDIFKDMDMHIKIYSL